MVARAGEEIKIGGKARKKEWTLLNARNPQDEAASVYKVLRTSEPSSGQDATIEGNQAPWLSPRCVLVNSWCNP